MNISANKVDGDMKYYLKKGLKNVWNHQVVYLLPLLFMIPTFGFLSFTPSPVRNVLMFFIGLFFALFYMEITFTSTQEKYTPKKYITSLMVAGFTFVGFIKRHLLIISIILSIGFAIDLTSFLMKDAEVSKHGLMVDFLVGVIRFAGTNSLYDIALIGYIVKEVLSDFFVAERMSGLNGETPMSVTEDAVSKNSDMMRNMAYFGLIFSLFAPVMLGLQSICFIVIIAALTFYSMDVFGVDTGKKQRALEEEKAMAEQRNMVPIRIGN